MTSTSSAIGPRATADFSREQLILDGFLKHREVGLVNRWRHRYLEFKVSSAGRLSFTVYKDKPATPSNELLEIPIEEYGGLDSALKMDGERHVFGVITMSSTECFAAENHETLQEWCSTIREFLGKELVLNINIPFKQHMLRPGKALIRIRNTGFTITTAEVPPKCQGSWQILHIRKFGGSEQFRFETGSKCPSGQGMYVIDTTDNEKMKSVFTDLSMHKPIFRDDRMGRRMTQEHTLLLDIRNKMSSTKSLLGGHTQIGYRRSLQPTPTSGGAQYENQSEFRRTSVQHENSRNRSNAILLQDPGEFSMTQTLPLPASKRENTYYNQPRPLNAPPSSQIRASSDPPPQERLYQNHVCPNSQHSHTVTPRNRRLSSESCESDDDFVDVHEIREQNSDGGVLYYNTREVMKGPPDNGIMYENFTPTCTGHNSDNKVMIEDKAGEEEREEGEPLPMYTNITICPQNKSGSPSLTPVLGRLSKGHTWSSSCDNLLSSTPTQSSKQTEDVNNTINDDDTAYHSDTEISHFRHDTLTSIDNKQRSPSPLVFASSSTTNNNGSHSPQRRGSSQKANSSSNYDHLEPRKRNQEKADENNSRISPPTLERNNKKGVSKVGGVWQSRRVHTYEDVDVPLDDQRSSSSSIDSAFNEEAPPTNISDPYLRKVSLFGRKHSYEYIDVMTKRELTGSLGGGGEGTTSPTRSLSPNQDTKRLSVSRPPLPWQDGSVELGQTMPPNSANESPRHKIKKPKPTPRKGNENLTKSTNDYPSSSSGVFQPSILPQGQLSSSSHTLPMVPPRPAKPASLSESSPLPPPPPPPSAVSNYRSKILKGLPRSMSHNEALIGEDSHNNKPALPPRIKEVEEPSTNYTPIYIKSGPREHNVVTTSLGGRGGSRIGVRSTIPPKRVVSSQDINVNYSDINHFLTRQIQTMREEREIEKGMAAL